MEILIVLLVAGLAVLAGLAAALKLLVGLVLLPFKILGLLVKGIGSLFGLAFGLVSGLFGLLLGLIGVVAAVLVLPLLPLIVLGGIVWLIVRAARPQPVPAEVRIVRG
jgi:hypothetical protein